MATIAERIKEALEIRNMKQIDLVEKTKIGKSSISTYISGAYEPKQKNIYKIAKALNVDEAWLMGLDVPMDKAENIDLNSSLTLSKDEITLLENFNKLNSKGKEKLIDYSDDLTANIKYIDNNKISATKDNVIKLGKKELTYDDFETVAAHNDDLTDDEISEVDRRILEDLNKRNK